MRDEIVLYHYWRSSCSWRVRWALNHKKIPHRLIAVDLLKGEQKSAEYLRRNPAGFVPTLEWKGNFYSESLAILEWLEESFPQAPLLPSDAHSRMIVRQLALEIIAGTQPHQNLSVLNYFSSDASRKKEISVHFITRGLAAYERLLNGKSGTYSYGSQITFADLALVPQCYNALRNEIDLGQFPLIHGIYKRCLKTEACKTSAPEAHQI
jgi:maleylacetoacetate isomerase